MPSRIHVRPIFQEGPYLLVSETVGPCRVSRVILNSASGWIDWNILLDENGGPNHVANFCYAPVIANTRTGELIYMSSYYYMGHFSKFIRPGAQRIICSSNYDDLLATAFINQDKSIAVVVMNQTDKEIEYKIWMEGRGTQTKIPAHSISTLVIN